MTTKEMREQKAHLALQAKNILAEANGRMTTEQEQKFDTLHTDIEKLNKDIERTERQETVERELAASSAPNADEQREQGRETTKASANDSLEAVRSWALSGPSIEAELSEEQRAACRRMGVNPKANQITLRLMPTGEMRALTTGTGSSGGNTISTGFVPRLEQALIAVSSVRNQATVIRTASGNALQFPTADDTSNVGAILAENATMASSTDPTFSLITLNAYTYHSKPVLVPIQLLQDTEVGLEDFIVNILGTRIGRIQNLHYTTGDNSSKPNGIVTAATLGKTAASATAITFPELVDLEHSVDPIYRTGAKFMFKDSTLQALKKLVDGSSRPLWQPGISATFANGAPDTINGYPYVINQDMAAIATGNKTILFGDLSKYLVRECTDLVLKRLDERYADNLQVAFMAYVRSDGDLLDAGTHPVKYLAQL